MEKWIRICPVCSIEIEHATKKIRNATQKKNLPCFVCKLQMQRGVKIEKLCCPMCKFECCHADGFSLHLKESHGTTIFDTYVKYLCNEVLPICPAKCGRPLSFNGWKKGFSSIHQECYDEKLIKTPEEVRLINEKRALAHTGTIGWAKGKTKENDERILARAEKTKEGIHIAQEKGTWPEPWSKGKTKEIDERLQLLARKISESYSSGRASQWAKGKTKETDMRLAVKGKDFSDKCKSGEIVPWHKGKTSETDERLFKKGKERIGKPAVAPFTREQIIERTSKFQNIKLIEDSLINYRNQMTPLIFECLSCRKENKLSLYQSYGDRCRFCQPTISKQQQEIFDFVKTCLTEFEEVIINDRKVLHPQELDIFIPSRNFAIEVNGIYWHSSAFKNENFHAAKTEEAKKRGVELIQIFEDEWVYKKKFVESFILEKLSKTPLNILVEECVIAQVGLNERKMFFEMNHLEGYVSDDNGIGLYKNDELLACVSLIRQQTDKNICEIRYCSKLLTNVKNGFVVLTNEAIGWSNSIGIESVVYIHDERFGNLSWMSPTTKTFMSSPKFFWTDYKSRFLQENFSIEKCARPEVMKIWGCNIKICKIV